MYTYAFSPTVLLNNLDSGHSCGYIRVIFVRRILPTRRKNRQRQVKCQYIMYIKKNMKCKNKWLCKLSKHVRKIKPKAL